MKVNIWHITGYTGRNDYDGSEDDNRDFKIAMDAAFSKADIEQIMLNYWNKFYENVAVKAELIETKEIEGIERR